MKVYKYILAFAVVISVTVQAQGVKYKLGRSATSDEINAWDYAINPEGNELPDGSGDAKTGAQLYLMKCMGCHGPQASGGLAPKLVGKNTVVANYPFATSLWDYIYRAMPLNQEGSLSFDETYALTAYLLNQGSVIDETLVLDEDNLANVEMPNRDGYAPPPIDQWEPGTPRLFKIIDP